MLHFIAADPGIWCFFDSGIIFFMDSGIRDKLFLDPRFNPYFLKLGNNFCRVSCISTVTEAEKICISYIVTVAEAVKMVLVTYIVTAKPGENVLLTSSRQLLCCVLWNVARQHSV